jgi:hypothetical protein
MFDSSAIGLEGAPYDMTVERGKIREFALATRAEDAGYRASDRPVSPPTFLASAALWEGPGCSPFDGLEFNLDRVLHGEQEFVFFGPPPRAGDELTARQRVDNVFTKQGKRGGEMSFITVVTDFHDRTGELIAQARMTVVETSQAPAGSE